MHFIPNNTKISDLADIEISSKGSKFIIGLNCLVDSFVKIKFTGGTGDIVIGNNCYINSGCVFPTVKEALAVHPLESVTTTLYAP